MSIVYANRGMGLETLIEHANAQYASKGIAQIQKIATPWKVIRKGKQIVSAFPEKKSTVDFIGVYGKGRALAFDAKSTQNKTRIPLANFEDHQIKFLLQCCRMGGSAFYIIEFKTLGEIYYLHILDFFEWYSRFRNESLTLEWIRRKGIKVESGNGIVLDYLKSVEEWSA
ncbi:Holliday junction resolvase RecU [Paenibacillus sp. H1-7]|uniref:Holliday junction resolvase RecU n=1 Tax=Paenibacillus sp. H1-7 TaxID=2282849 RepID=UPI001EF884E7|nr:Holliday junction resolvase RecU [Paenibacillus sp. H1-7]ULL14344.1 Holliday junction resolvase RecU [Paenibacillus sp. H1-7]